MEPAGGAAEVSAPGLRLLLRLRFRPCPDPGPDRRRGIGIRLCPIPVPDPVTRTEGTRIIIGNGNGTIQRIGMKSLAKPLKIFTIRDPLLAKGLENSVWGRSPR